MPEPLTVVIPAYNERASLERNLPDWLGWCEAHDAHLIVVDDGSADGTEQALAAHAAHPRLRAFQHRVNRGYGEALKTGLYHAETPLAATMDADGQHAIEDLDRLRAALVEHDADLVIGARPAAGEDPYRRAGKAVIRGLARLLFGTRIQDLNSGMKVYRTALATRLLPFCPGSMAFSDVITLAHLNLGCRVVEAPIVVRPRQGGHSTINTMTAVETVLEIVNVLMWFKPLKVFLPLASLLLLAGVLWALPFLLIGRGLSSISLLLILTGLMCAMLGLIAEQLAWGRRVELPDLAAREIGPGR